MKAEKTPFEMMLLNSKELIIPKNYQRRLRAARVARIVANFDERIANEPKVSYRDGHFFVFDGQHTVSARKARNHGKDLLIRCKVFRGLTEQDEALLFAQQTGESAKLTPSAQLRALLQGRDPKAMAFRNATEEAGFHIGFESARGSRRIVCINTAFSKFKAVGAKQYKEALGIISAAWNGVPASLRTEILHGVVGFVSLYHGEYDRLRLVQCLHDTDPLTICRDGKADTNLTGPKKYIKQVFLIYNGTCQKQALPIKF